MARRGQCRCGLVLTFRRTARGYKMRCPSCGAVVRLRVPGKGGKPPLDRAPPAAGEIDVELIPFPDLPATSPPPPARSRRMLVVIVGAVVLMSVVGGAVWWFSH